MDEYLLFMRLDLITKEAQPSPEQMQEYMKQYHAWVDGIVAQNKFIGGKGLSFEGRVIKPHDVITDGPYAEIKESIAGFIMVKATDFDDAVKMARLCPILNGEGNSVEVRKVMSVHEAK
jgi:hypothetical protein